MAAAAARPTDTDCHSFNQGSEREAASREKEEKTLFTWKEEEKKLASLLLLLLLRPSTFSFLTGTEWKAKGKEQEPSPLLPSLSPPLCLAGRGAR